MSNERRAHDSIGARNPPGAPGGLILHLPDAGGARGPAPEGFDPQGSCAEAAQ